MVSSSGYLPDWSTIVSHDVIDRLSADIDSEDFAINSPSRDYTNPDDHTSPTYDITPGLNLHGKMAKIIQRRRRLRDLIQ